MGTEVEIKSYLPGYYLMRDLNEDSNGRSWPLYYGDKTVTNGQYYNGFLQRNVVESYPGYDKEAMKQKILEHEAVFKNQVYELHRLYRIQKDMMDDVKRKELHKHWIPMETSSSSTPFASSQMPHADARKWYISSYPLANSVSGAEIIHSPLSCTKINGAVPCHGPPEIGSSSMECEVLESRPSKVRKRLFDLQLPADEYIDEEEERPQDSKMSEISSSLINRNHKIAPESGTKLFLGGCVKIDSPGNGLADLNEPIRVEETAVAASVNFLGHAISRGEVKGHDLSAQPKSRFPNLPKELLRSDQYDRDNGTSNNTHFENKRRDWLSNTYESGHNKNNTNMYPQSLQPDKFPSSSQSTHIVPNKARQFPSNLTTDTNRRDLWKEGTLYGIEPAERSCDTSQFTRPEPIVASRIPSPYPFVNSLDLTNATPPTVTSWGKPSWNSQLHNNGNSRLTPGFGSEVSKRNNGFCYGSSSESKELPTSYPLVGFGDNFASENSYKYSYGNYFKGSSSVCNEAVDRVAVLPWLRANPDSKKLPNRCEPIEVPNRIFARNITPSLCNRDEGNKMILGFPIFGSLCPPQGSAETKNERKSGVTDLNLVSIEQITSELPEIENKVPNFKNHFDLNSCVTEDEVPLAPLVATANASVKFALEIDLEALPVPDPEEDIIPVEEQKPVETSSRDDVVRVAAEALVAISSSDHLDCQLSNSSSDNTLQWFVEIVSNCGDGVDRLDDFEVMTLNLAEIKEDEYMPKPLVPPCTMVEETAVSTRGARKGASRRGRHRRDFQRDILPGLASLSRHEVTEDLQTFGGLTRRSGSGRGRRKSSVTEPDPAAAASTISIPLVQQLNNLETGFEDRSLTGWGKTTRRPRRQRCPAGNPPPPTSVTLT